MALYAVIRKSIRDGLMASTNTPNPTERRLILDLESYPQVYLLNSLEDAKQVSELFFSPPRPPKTSGSYGLIAEVTAEFSDMPVATEVDIAILHNNWVDSQRINYFKKENIGVSCQCTVVSPTQIKSISQFFIPENAKAYNSNLQDVNFKLVQPAQSLCSLM